MLGGTGYRRPSWIGGDGGDGGGGDDGDIGGDSGEYGLCNNCRRLASSNSNFSLRSRASSLSEINCKH